MNKLLSIKRGLFALIMCLSFSLYGCGNTNQAEEPVNTSSVETQQREDTLSKELEELIYGKATTIYSETKKITSTITEQTTTEIIETSSTAKVTTSETEKSTESTKSESSPDDVRKAVQNGDYSFVTPEFKETMDAYEAFYDEYIAFMNNYTSGQGDIMSMLADYTNMLEKMDEWTRKMNAIDESTLSPADDAYFLLVTLRIERKLLGSL